MTASPKGIREGALRGLRHEHELRSVHRLDVEVPDDCLSLRHHITSPAATSCGYRLSPTSQPGSAADRHAPSVAKRTTNVPFGNVLRVCAAALEHLAERPDLACNQVCAESSEARVVVVSEYVELSYAEDLSAAGGGGIGYLLKDRVERVAAGGMVIEPDRGIRADRPPRRPNPGAHYTRAGGPRAGG